MDFDRTPARLLIGAMATGALLVLVGLFTSPALLVLGVLVAAFVPLAYAVLEIERNGAGPYRDRPRRPRPRHR